MQDRLNLLVAQENRHSGKATEKCQILIIEIQAISQEGKAYPNNILIGHYVGKRR